MSAMSRSIRSEKDDIEGFPILNLEADTEGEKTSTSFASNKENIGMSTTIGPKPKQKAKQRSTKLQATEKIEEIDKECVPDAKLNGTLESIDVSAESAEVFKIAPSRLRGAGLEQPENEKSACETAANQYENAENGESGSSFDGAVLSESIENIDDDPPPSSNKTINKKRRQSLALVPVGARDIAVIGEKETISHELIAQMQANFVPTSWPSAISSHAPRRHFHLKHDNKLKNNASGCFDDDAKYTCFICDQSKSETGESTVACQGLIDGWVKENRGKVGKCRTRFHLSCITKYNASDYCASYIVQPECQNKLYCPLHFCDVCHMDRRKQTAFEGRMIECALCFRAFHYETCAPVGSKDLEVALSIDEKVGTVEMIICQAHFTKQKPIRHLPNCCECEKSKGDLISCAQCVRSFHAECRSVKTVDGKNVVEDLCEFCLMKETVRANKSVVAKWTDNKFYPAYTRLWEKCPNSLRKNDKYDRHGYCVLEWVSPAMGGKSTFSIGCINDFVPMFQSSIRVLAKKIKPDYRPVWQQMLENTEDEFQYPSMFKDVRKRVDTSKYLSKDWEKQVAFTELDNFVCQCRSDEAEKCATDKCTNRQAHIECPPECNEKGKCHNREISEKRVNGSIERRRTENKGFGVFALKDIDEGDFIAEYAGEIISKKEVERRNQMLITARDDQANLYMMSLDRGNAVDAARAGNIARYINHSCDPNCQTVKRTVMVKEKKDRTLYDYRIAIVAIRKIHPEEELTFRYQMEDIANARAPQCKCGSEKCAGSLGGAKKFLSKEELVEESETDEESDTEKTAVVKKKGEQKSGSNMKIVKFDHKKTVARSTKRQSSCPMQTNLSTAKGKKRSVGSRSTVHESINIGQPGPSSKKPRQGQGSSTNTKEGIQTPNGFVPKPSDEDREAYQRCVEYDEACRMYGGMDVVDRFTGIKHAMKNGLEFIPPCFLPELCRHLNYARSYGYGAEHRDCERCIAIMEQDSTSLYQNNPTSVNIDEYKPHSHLPILLGLPDTNTLQEKEQNINTEMGESGQNVTVANRQQKTRSRKSTKALAPKMNDRGSTVVPVPSTPSVSRSTGKKKRLAKLANDGQQMSNNLQMLRRSPRLSLSPARFPSLLSPTVNKNLKTVNADVSERMADEVVPDSEPIVDNEAPSNSSVVVNQSKKKVKRNGSMGMEINETQHISSSALVGKSAGRNRRH